MDDINQYDITPWEQDYIFTIRYDDRLGKINKKLKGIISDKNILGLKSTKEVFNQYQQVSAQLNRNVQTIKAVNKKQFRNKSHEELINFKTYDSKLQKLKEKMYIQKNKSAFIGSLSPSKDNDQISSNFSVKKICRIKRFQKFLAKEIKNEQIFTKVNNIQNPLKRQNIYLPKIQIKI